MSVSIISLPNSLQEWPAQLADSAYHIQGEQLVPAAAVSDSYLLVWAKHLAKPQLQTLFAELEGLAGQFYLHGLAEVAANQVVLLSSTQDIASLQAWVKLQNGELDLMALEQLPELDKPGLVLMDMDSTTIQIECIDEIAKLADVGEQVSEVTAAAMRGELDFEQSLRSRVGLLEDAPESVLKQVADAMPYMPGLEALIACLHQGKWKVAIASGGFTYFAERLQQDLGFDSVKANLLEIIDGKLTGKVLGAVVDAQAKAVELARLAELYQVEQTMAIGDGANDLKMLAAADYGVAIHAKPLVAEQAQLAVKHSDLDGVVCLLKAAELVKG